MPSVRELFDLARQCYAESNRALNPDVREAPRNKGDSHMEKADELRRSEFSKAHLHATKRLDRPIGRS